MRVRAKLNKADAAPTADEQTAEVNKLSHITVEEVSIVDRPANRRTFLVVKSARGAEPEPAEKPAPMKIKANEKAKLTQKVQAASAAISAMQTVLDSAEESDDAADVPEELQATMDAVSKLLGKPAPVPETPPVTKAGRKFSAANESKLRDAQKLISELLGDDTKDDEPVVPDTAATAKATAPKTEPKVEEKPAAKNETTEAIESLTNVVSTLVTAVKAQKQRLDQLSDATPGTRQVTKAGEGDDDEPEVKAEDEFTWSMDMNRPHTRVNTPVEKSFFES